MHSDLYNKIISYDNLVSAAKQAMKNKLTRSLYYTYNFNLENNVYKLFNKLQLNTYKPTSPKQFEKWCISGQKMRIINAPCLDDLVLQHAIYIQIYPLLDKKLIKDTYGCRLGGGTLKAGNRCKDFVKKSNKDSYYLQLDIRKYYYSIPQDKLKETLKFFIKEDDVINLIFTQFPNQSVGLYVGYLLSQVMGLIYLSRLDHYIKRVLKLKYYIRYVDDFIILNLTKDQCLYYKEILEKYINTVLGLSLSKFKIQPISKGINFVGYRTWHTKRLIRKRSLKNFTKQAKLNNLDSIISILGHAKYTSSYKNLLEKTLYWLSYSNLAKLPIVIKQDIIRYV